MNKYEVLKNEIQSEYNKFPFGFAFSNEQFEKMKEKLGVKEDSELVSIGAGGFVRKTDVKALNEMAERNDKKMKDAIAQDLTGEGFIKDMFRYELANHEYCITYDLDDTLDALDLTYEEVMNDDRLKHGLELAKREYLDSIDEW